MSSSGTLDRIAPKTELNDYSVDIVAVPGLGADPTGSFISEEGSRFDWLTDEKDGILSEITTARVLKYGYDSRWLGDNALRQTLGNVAEQLLVSLVAARKDHEDRPIIFVAHSLGGLVVAKALIIATSHPEKIGRMRIYECFAGAIFFGTPFGGSEEAARAVMLASFLEPMKKGIPSQMIQMLDPQRDSLMELRSDFAQLVQKEPKAGIACISEQKPTNYAKALGHFLPKFMHLTGLVVTKHSATLDGAQSAAMACDHRQLNRFASGKDPRFNIVKEYLVEFERDARRIVVKRLNVSKRSLVNDATFASLSDNLNIVQFQQKRRSLEMASGNSEWILKEPAFLQWLPWNLQEDGSQFLWISGSEGLGKSKAALAAVEELEKMETLERRDESQVIVAYFFCEPTTDSQTAENLLKSLIWQMILKRRSLAQYVRGFAAPKSAKSASTRNSISFSKLWSGLQDMLRDDSAPRVYFVVNNLHYLADNESTAEFWDKIRDLVEDSNGAEEPIKKNVKWMFLSRLREQYRSVFLSQNDGKVLWVNLEDGTKNDELRQMLKTFTYDRVKTLACIKGYSLALQYFLTSVLLKKAENNKLWVEVVCCLLEALPSSYVEVRKTLESLPQDVVELMSRVWENSLSENAEAIHRTKEILRTLAIVFEHPTLDELKVLAELDDAIDATQILEQVRACGPLLRVYDEDSTGGDLSEITGSFRVTFIHDTAKEALLGKGTARKLIGFSDLSDGNDHTDIKLQHGILALRCFSHTNHETERDGDYISFFQSQASNDKNEGSAPELQGLFPEANNGDDGEDDNDSIYEEASLEYPVKYWLRHGYEATPDFVDTLDLKNSFWASESSARQRWWSSYARGDNAVTGDLKNLTAMHVAAYFGLTPLIDSLMREGHENEIRIRDSWDNQPLHWAAARGHVEAMEKLILHGADINDGQQDQVWTPLHMAASEGRLEAMKLLMRGQDEKVNLDAVAKDIGTALTLALASNQDKAVELLLTSGASPTLTAENGESPIAMAAYMDEEELTQMLLEKGGAHCLASERFGSAIAAAAAAGRISIVKILLPYSDITSYEGALKEATRKGFHLIVKLLLQSSQRLRYGDDFQMAASMGHDLVLKELWNHNRAQNGTALSQNAINDALYMAAENEQETTCTFLLEVCHAEPNALGVKHGNAVTAAAYDGNIAILRKLIQFGADVNASSGCPLQVAASQGHLEAVKLLLDHHASIDAISPLFPDGTALQAACVARQIKIANELLERGANPNLGSGPLTNPMIAVTTNALGDLALSLLQKGADPNVFGGADGSTPLINAACRLSSEYLSGMIRYGALVDTVDRDGDTALIMSAYYGDIDCVRILLDLGANMKTCGKNYGTALHVAAQEGYPEICQLLLERGADPSIRGGPYDTVVQAAAYSGEQACMEVLLNNKPWSHRININLQGGKCFTALHAAAVNAGDGSLRLLLKSEPNLNALRKGDASATTALYAAAFAGCNRNARLLLEADADPNIGCGKHGTILQVAALKCGPDLCELLIERGAKLDDWSGKYGSALVAATVKAYHDGKTDVLQSLLEQDFPPRAYRAALDRAFLLRRKDAFEMIWQSIKSKGPKKLRLNTTGLLAGYRRSLARRMDNKATDHEDENSDFDNDMEFYDQDIESDEEESVDDDDDDDQGDSNGDNRNADAAANERRIDRAEYQQSNNVATGMGPRNTPDVSRGMIGRETSGTARANDRADSTQGHSLSARENSKDPRSVGYNDSSEEYHGEAGTGGNFMGRQRKEKRDGVDAPVEELDREEFSGEKLGREKQKSRGLNTQELDDKALENEEPHDEESHEYDGEERENEEVNDKESHEHGGEEGENEEGEHGGEEGENEEGENEEGEHGGEEGENEEGENEEGENEEGENEEGENEEGENEEGRMRKRGMRYRTSMMEKKMRNRTGMMKMNKRMRNKIGRN
ncbi:ankyrin repeat-containing domain protein [Rhexocercosporidium sp. MPI-PUGE-AT-0058]|nr:ankyrin repeat-containing domain protein [Rhexocercosporidium sp. MPI-PUGE-AT-0058]